MIMNASPAAKYEIIKEMTSRDDNLLNIKWLCEIAGVSRSGYYYWLNAEDGREARERQDERDFEMILVAFQFRGYAKGARGIHMRLLHLTPAVLMNVKKIRRLMKKYKLRCPIRRANPYRRMAKEMQSNRVAPNLLNREFRTRGARVVLLTDITYIPRSKRTEEGGDKYSYLCVIMDAFTKQILAYTVSLSLEVDFVLETVQQLIEKHDSELNTDVLVHSDQGCHYTSNRFVEVLNDYDLRQSMSRRANCWDNAPQESLFGHMKEEIHILPSDTHANIVRKVDDWVDYYNNDRYQWGLAKLSPNEFYQYTKTGVYPLQTEPPAATEKGNDDDTD
jgi:transposase InsO family protein